MSKILMVCLGNICRSPLAEGILKAKTNHLDVLVDSAGTSAYHISEQPDIRSIAIAKKHGIDLSCQRARQFCINDFDKFDKIYAMDTSNYTNIISLARSESDKEKVDLILNEINPRSFQSVPDPYYGGDNGFQDVYDMLDKACVKIVEQLG
ncbi:MAG: low molecular weight protein-tyrosine-phosphatase [Bacteroidota bacterium]|nr:low molecular weight protein-tyrosine-phosphatase [Bacteroidota bacterium]